MYSSALNAWKKGVRRVCTSSWSSGQIQDTKQCFAFGKGLVNDIIDKDGEWNWWYCCVGMIGQGKHPHWLWHAEALPCNYTGIDFHNPFPSAGTYHFPIWRCAKVWLIRPYHKTSQANLYIFDGFCWHLRRITASQLPPLSHIQPPESGCCCHGIEWLHQGGFV